MVTDALRLHNTDECFMTKSVHNKVPYYQSKSAHLADLTNIGPCKQRFKKLSEGRKTLMKSNPTKFFFDAGNRHFGLINDALSEIEGKEIGNNQSRAHYVCDKAFYIIFIPY